MPDPDLPAILGGIPVRPAGPPTWPVQDPDILAQLQSSYESGNWGQYHGTCVPKLEEELRQFFQTQNVILCASGTLAVETALGVLGINSGDEVIQAAYDYEANFLSIHQLGGKPVLVDIDPTNGNLDIASLKNSINEKTKAILCSHLHGGLIPMPEVMEFARSHSIPVIEDSAQATGARIEGKYAGTWGDLGTISFGGSKLLSAGRGGAIFSNRADLAQRIKLKLSRGVQNWGVLSELQATVLLPQLGKLAGRNQYRREQIQLLDSLLENIPGLRRFQNKGFTSEAAYYKVGFYLDASAFGLSREKFVAAMRAEGIAFDTGFAALHRGRSKNRYHSKVSLKEADIAHESIVQLHHPILLESPRAMFEVAESIQKIYRNAKRLAA